MVVVVGVLAALVAGCAPQQPARPPVEAVVEPDRPAVPVREEISYAVTGRGQADVTYVNTTGDIQQTSTLLPFERTFRVEPGAYVSVLAQSTTLSNRPLVCTIRRDGAEVSRATTDADYGIASCSD